MLISRYIEGKNIKLREIEIADAAFVLSLRLDPELGQHLSQTEPDLQKQQRWIESYKKNALDYYFIIQNNQDKPVGTVRIYDIQNTTFNWGSWIVIKEARHYASFESAVLSYEFAFSQLGLLESHFDARRANQKAINFYLRFGAKLTGEDAENFYFCFKKIDFFSQREQYFLTIDEIARKSKNVSA